MIKINRHPSRRELNWFGLLFALFFGVIGLLVLWRSGAVGVTRAIWGIAAAITVLYYLVPPFRRPIYLGWMYAAYPIGLVLSHVLLAAVYYLVFTPMGLLMRLIGRDALQRRFDPEAETYWTDHDPGGDPARYFRQF